MILIDYNQVALAAILSFQRDLLNGDVENQTDLIRHVTLSSIKNYKQKYGKKYGDVIIACDGRNYWRRDYFPPYKGLRKKARDKSDLDWKLIFDTLDSIRTDLKEIFPYKVIHLDGCEADDVIGVLAENTQQLGRYEEVMIISSDKDFKQLQKYSNVKQYSPMQKKLINVTTSELKGWMIEHIVKGDSGDGVPNILSGDNFLIDGIRQKPVSKKRLEEFIENGVDACRTDEERRNWDRNQKLVDFSRIPEEISDKIIEAYEYIPKGDKNSVMNYLIKHKCRVLLNEIEAF